MSWFLLISDISRIFNDFLDSDFFQYFAIKFIWAYSSFAVNIEQFAKSVYDSQEWIQYPVDCAVWIGESTDMLWNYGVKCEPNTPRWISQCILVYPKLLSLSTTQPPQIFIYDGFDVIDNSIYNTSINGRFHFGETYLTGCDDCERLNVRYVRDFSELTKRSETNDSIADSISIMKLDELYTVRIHNSRLVNAPQSRDISTFRILNAEYIHPKMSNTLRLEVPREWLCVGNQLFSPVFVRRCLEYQHGNKQFVFDLEYSIRVIDGEINQFEISSNQYLQIGANNGAVGKLVVS